MTDTAAGSQPGIYERLGVRRIINAAGPVTRLGGKRLAPEVAEVAAFLALLSASLKREG